MTTAASAKLLRGGLEIAAAMVERKRKFDTAFKLKVIDYASKHSNKVTTPSAIACRGVADHLSSLLRSPHCCPVGVVPTHNDVETERFVHLAHLAHTM